MTKREIFKMYNDNRIELVKTLEQIGFKHLKNDWRCVYRGEYYINMNLMPDDPRVFIEIYKGTKVVKENAVRHENVIEYIMGYTNVKEE